MLCLEMSISIAAGINNVTPIRKRCSNFIIKLQHAVAGVARMTTEEVLILIFTRLFLRLLCHLLRIMVHYYIQDSTI
jgi:hypothetical protein